MKTVYRLTIALIAIVTSFAITACKSDLAPLWEISSIGCWIGNWAPVNSNDGSAYLIMSIYFDNSGPMSSDIESFRISPPNGGYWLFDKQDEIDASFMTTDDGKKYIETSRMYSDDLSNGSVLPIGTYIVNVKFKDGSSDEYSQLVSAPGSTTTNGKEFVYTENYYLYYDPPDTHVALPSRATIVSAVYTEASSEITIEFTVQDDIIYNGLVIFYDSADPDPEYIAVSSLFRDSKTKEINTVLNGGNSFHIDNNKNTVVLTEDNIKFEDGKAMNDIAQLRLSLRDGKQYANLEYADYDTYSVTAYYPLTKE